MARRYDTASALWIGGPSRRDQQDALIVDFHAGNPFGFAVLADGVGGSGPKTSGSVASRVATIDAMRHFKFLMHDGLALEARIGPELRAALDLANEKIDKRIEARPDLSGMATTFLATVLFEDRLYWVSVGDSPLFLLRGGRIARLNQNHSRAYLVERDLADGRITEEQARRDSRRNVIESALTGDPDQMALIDLREEPWQVQAGDILLVASDGLEYLSEQAIADEIAALGPAPSSQAVCDRLMEALAALAHPKQDNTALLVIQTLPAAQGATGVAQDDVRTREMEVQTPVDPEMQDPQPARPRFSWKKLLFPVLVAAGLALAGGMALRVAAPGMPMAQDQTPEVATPTSTGSKQEGVASASAPASVPGSGTGASAGASPGAGMEAGTGEGAGSHGWPSRTHHY